jgi:hypothetical protein
LISLDLNTEVVDSSLDALRQDGEVGNVGNVHVAAPLQCGAAPTPQPAPAQQFSVRKPTSPLIASKLAE